MEKVRLWSTELGALARNLGARRPIVSVSNLE